MNHLVRQIMAGGATEPPATVTITSDESDFTDATPFEIQITFDKPRNDLVVGDINKTNCTLSNFANSGDDLVYTVDVTPDLSDDITISIDANVTAEGNSASNVVTVTDNQPAAPAPYIYGRDDNEFANLYEGTDFSGQTLHNCSFITGGWRMDVVGGGSRNWGVSMYFDDFTLQSGVEVQLHRKYISDTLGYDAYNDLGNYVEAARNYSFGVVFDEDQSSVVTNVGANSRYTPFGPSGQKVIGCGMGRGATYGGVLSLFGAIQTTGAATRYVHGNVNDPQDGDLKIVLSKDTTYWRAKLYLDNVEVIDHLTNIEHATTTTVMPYISANAHGDGTGSIEELTNLVITDVS